jgi:hypothetical protein
MSAKKIHGMIKQITAATNQDNFADLHVLTEDGEIFRYHKDKWVALDVSDFRVIQSSWTKEDDAGKELDKLPAPEHHEGA